MSVATAELPVDRSRAARAAVWGGLPAGWATAALDGVLHFLIAFIWATAYWLASRKLKVLVQHPVVCGLLYGFAAYAFMYLVVLPLSAAYFKPTFTPSTVSLNGAGHMLLVGLPISLAADKFSNKTGRER